ncbi:MAG TPA: right-handed parallel beta-helix repeat-containing protein [Bryobacteraceae bacterium]|jgi:parallel beta-helix repeat protein|nr:right-handed parallel beta-helix repeat-containing protein [Bryobacteraceae bacterium]
MYRPSLLSALLGGICFIACQPSFAATWCVNTGGTGGCKATIGVAVAAASAGDIIQVAAGTFAESVIIQKSLSLIGAGIGATTIDATGQPNGVFIDGTMGSPGTGVSGVVVSGFTIENANFEGILVASATDVTISENEVMNNNLALSQGCPGLPAFETNEAQDCGEGVHLMGADHSIVDDNLVHNNSGGILISDETGPNHDNLVTRNTVNSNGYACGITLASHPAASLANPTSPLSFGIYHNTISENESSSNGLSNGGGAGIGLYAQGPGAQTYGNVVIGNTITGNGLPGVAMHNHAAPPGAPAINFNDNSIIGNTIRLNAADSEDAATAGPTGINIYSLTPMTGTVVAQNVIDHESIDLAVNVASGGAGPQIQAHLNDFAPFGFRPYTQGISNTGGALVDATENWWGCSAGPEALNGCTKASSGVNFMPWLTQPATSPLLRTGPHPLLRIQ